MISRINRLLPFAVIIGLTITACANQIHRKDVTAQSAREVSGSITATNNQIDATLESLNNLMASNPTELPAAFDNYSKEVDKMHAQAERINKEAATLRNQSQNYLADWQRQHNEIQNTELRNTSEQRRQEVMARFQNIQMSYDNARTSLGEFMSNLDDVRTASRNDLTAHGLQAIAETTVVKDAQKHASNVKTALQQVESRSSALADALAPAAPASTQNQAGSVSSQSKGAGPATSSSPSAQSPAGSSSSNQSAPQPDNTSSSSSNTNQ